MNKVLWILVVGLFPVTTAAQEELTQRESREIIGYYYQCTAKVEIGENALSGRFNINNQDIISEFYASYYPKTDPNRDRPYSKYRLSWSVSWREFRRNGWTSVPLFFGNGLLALRIQREKSLPKSLYLSVHRDTYPTASLIDFSERWIGAKNSATFNFPVGEILGFAGDSANVVWKLNRSPAKGDYKSRSGIAGGQLDLRDIRKLEASFEELRKKLMAKASDKKNACESKPNYEVDDDVL